MKITVLAILLFAFAALTGCASLPPSLAGGYSTSPVAYEIPQARTIQEVRLGTVVAVRSVQIQPGSTQRATGSGLGAVLGALVGHQIGNGRGREAATVVGAVGGLIGGNLVAARAYQQPGLAITVRLDRGNTVQVTQAADVPIAAGQRVELVGNGWYNSPARVLPITAQ